MRETLRCQGPSNLFCWDNHGKEHLLIARFDEGRSYTQIRVLLLGKVETTSGHCKTVIRICLKMNTFSRVDWSLNFFCTLNFNIEALDWFLQVAVLKIEAICDNQKNLCNCHQLNWLQSISKLYVTIMLVIIPSQIAYSHLQLTLH